MTFTFDASDDLTLVADGLAPLTYEPLTGDSVDVPRALGRSVSRREAEASAGLALQGDVKFRVPTSALPEEPALGATLIDSDGARWTILSVSRDVLGACYSCTTRNLTIAAGLDQTVVIEQATFAKTADGTAEPTWSDYTTLQARLQPATTYIADEHGQSIARSEYRVILEHALDWSPDRRWRVRAGDATYAVVGYEQAARIDVLPVLLVARSPWPLS